MTNKNKNIHKDLKHNPQEKPSITEMEEKILSYWEETDAFEKSVEMRPKDKPYVFYDGPPFATGLPHYGHILASTAKDLIPRYFTMKGYRVERTWGWDCHGVPIENMIEQELELEGGKKGIEKLGIDKFNQACRSAILRFDEEWEKVISRIGRWVDFKNSYKTMDKSYMESVWWAFKNLYEKDLVYQGRKVILYCPRCGTPLSKFEIAMDNSYKLVKDNSVTIAFERKDKKDEYFLAWTTTPWTLIGNVALALKSDADYVKIEKDDKKYWLAKSRLKDLDFESAKILQTKKGKDLEGIEYKPLYPYMPTEEKKAFYLTTADFVELDEGTGIVHTAAIFGEEDYELALEKDLPTIDTLDEEGKFMDFVEPLAGQFYKKGENWVIEDLSKRSLLFRHEKAEHEYPFCYRCGTPLYYNAIPAWFINIQKIKDQLIQANEEINWHPEFLKHGRFKKGLESAPDWNISRSRYWGTPMPIWINQETEQIRIIGSIEELKKWAVSPEKVDEIDDIHREFIDDLEVWVDDEKTLKGTRIPEVFDCWVESGSMPFASLHYPFESKEKFEKSYPAQFISEYIAQTRAWFYTLHVLSVALFDEPAFKNVVTTGTILAEDGSKMSKSKKNFPDPKHLIEKYGVDSLRFYLMSSPVMNANNLRFSEREVAEIYKKVILIFYNTFSFYKLYSDGLHTQDPKPEHVLDRWVISRLQKAIQKVTQSLDNYDTVSAARELRQLVQDISTWYVRLSRQRIRNNQKTGEIFSYILTETSKLLAPIIPFISEYTYLNLTPQKSSVHHEDWPEFDTKLFDEGLMQEMKLAKSIVEEGRAQRRSASIRIRQPLSGLTYFAPKEVSTETETVIAKEINVKKIKYEHSSEVNVKLNTKLTEELKREGQARDIARNIQKTRKKLSLQKDQSIRVILPEWPKKHAQWIKQKVNAQSLEKGDKLKVELVKNE